MKKKTYEVPAMQVIEFKSQQPLLVGSDPVYIQGYDKSSATSIFEEEDE